MPKNLSIRVRRKYFTDIVSGEKDKELRADSPFWHKKFAGGQYKQYIGGRITFLCGKDYYRCKITDIQKGDPEVFLGRPPSEQGRRDILPPDRITDSVWAIFLGGEVDANGQNIGGS